MSCLTLYRTFIISSAICLVTGGITILLTSKSSRDIGKREGYIIKNPVEVWEEDYQKLNADPMIKVRWVEQANDAIKYLKSKGAGD